MAKDSFSKGEIVYLSIEKRSGEYFRTHTGRYEIMRTGRLFYLYCDGSGHDLICTKEELICAIHKYNNCIPK